MADTVDNTLTGRSPESRVVRVFLSSTFRDFMQERDRLVKEVFPELRRKARERGVEVDLRWGITEEESRQGKVLPICLAEINRCRPYFVGMLGERYGWVPPDDEDNRVVLDDEAWVEEHLGRRSVTELEILHGVLNNPEMAGRAFFYFRDPAWSQAQSEPGFVCDSREEAEKLADLKQRILVSGFPVVRESDLPNPEALADRIGDDLWALIEEQFPDLDQADALEREERKHASYRRSRTELYEDGESGGGKISQLEQWIATGEQRILITGESGAGKSALIANWMQRHQQSHPDDVVFAHHLGCSNDANALEPMLARMVQSASKLMADELSEPIKVPQDYWELVSTVTETLSKLRDWCKARGCRWIWVMDGLDRMPVENQQALPWLPLQLFPPLHVVISALDCPARTILQEREYTTLKIGPLQEVEQKALIQATMRRYNKTLVPELEAKILEHEPARSPLFLRVVLDELRVCGRHETLAQQLDDYLKAPAVDALYAKVLERLEGDVGREVVEKVMTALWASRAGLGEPELQAITGVAPLQWAPIDLGLEGSFGRNGNRLVFDHDFLRFAVKERYLPREEQQRQAHSQLADWYQDREGWDERDSEELPWQLQQAGRLEDLRDWLLVPGILANLQWDRGSRETINYWLTVRNLGDGELDELIADDLEGEIEKRRADPEDLIWFVDRVAGLFDEAGLYREPLLKLRTLSLELEEASDDRSEESMLSSLAWLANTHRDLGQYDAALSLYQRQLVASERLLGPEHPDTLTTVGNLAGLFEDKGYYEQAEAYYKRCLEAQERLLGPEHPSTLTTLGNLGIIYRLKGDYEQAEAYYKRCLEARERLLGPEHPDTLTTVGNLGLLYSYKGDYEQAEAYDKRCLEASERLLGPEHPDTLTTVGNLAGLFQDKGDYEQAEAYYKRCLEASERLLGPEHPDTIPIIGNLAGLYSNKGDYEQAEAYYKRCLEAEERLLGPEHPSTLTTVGNLGLLYSNKGDYEQAEAYYKRCLEASEQLLGPEHPDTLTTLGNLGLLYSYKGDYEQAEAYDKRCLEAQERLLGPEHPSTLTTVGNLGLLYSYKGDYEQAEAYDKRCLEAQERLLGPEHPSTLTTLGNLGLLYSNKGDYEQAEAYYKRCLEAQERLLGPEHPSTLTTLGNLGIIYRLKGDYEQAEAYYKRCLEARERLLGPQHPSTLTMVGNLAGLFEDKGYYEQAEAYYKRCLEARERLLGPEHPDTQLSRAKLGDLGIALLGENDIEGAFRCLSEAVGVNQINHRNWEYHYELGRIFSKNGQHEKALDILTRLEGPNADLPDYQGLWLCIEEAARCCNALKLNDRAVFYARRAVDIACSADDADVFTISLSRIEMTLVALGVNEPNVACEIIGPLLKQSIDLKGQLEDDYWDLIESDLEDISSRIVASENQLTPESASVLVGVSDLCILYRNRGDDERAEALLTNSLQSQERLLGCDHPDTIPTRRELADLLSDQLRWEESIPLRRQALEIATKQFGSNAPATLTSMQQMADDLYWIGEMEESEELYREVLVGRIEVLGDDDAQTMESKQDLANCLSGQQRYSEAIALRREELAWRRRQIGDTDESTLSSINALASDLREAGQLQEAEQLFLELMNSQIRVLEPDDFQIASAQGGLAMTLELAGRLEEALQHRQAAMEHRIEHVGWNNYLSNQARLKAAELLHKLKRSGEALHLLDEFDASMSALEEPDDLDRQLMDQARELIAVIRSAET